MSNQGFVSFKREKEGFRAYINIDCAMELEKDLSKILEEAKEIYESHLSEMKKILEEIESFRRDSKNIPARKIWHLGDVIFSLIDKLEKLKLQIDGLYDHLIRDLKLKRKWLEKVIILRRYIESLEKIPENLNWGKCEKGTKQIARKINRGQY